MFSGSGTVYTGSTSPGSEPGSAPVGPVLPETSESLREEFKFMCGSAVLLSVSTSLQVTVVFSEFVLTCLGSADVDELCSAGGGRGVRIWIKRCENLDREV